jgi:hypothetical protein
MSQIMPVKVLDLRRYHCVIKPMPAILKRFARLGGLKYPPSAVA